MDSRKWWALLAVFALVACAAARPNEIDPTKTNEISKEVNEKVVVVPSITAPQPSHTEKTLSGDKVEVAAAVVDAVRETPKPLEAPKPGETPQPLEGSKPEAPKPEEVPLPEKEALRVGKAVNEQFPHAVLFGGTCGGSIISPNWVISAGHCTLFSGGRYVLAGTNNSEDGSGVIRHVKRLIIHPKFSVGPYWLDADRFDIKQVAANWDFLLAELEDPLPLDGKKIAAVTLDDGPSVPAGLEVGYAGYGAEHHGEVMREQMHGMELQVLADSECEQALVQYEPQAMLCTTGRPPRYDSACNGDSGSGLVANGKLYGVASWVENDAHRCYNGAKVVFSRIAAARDWIRQVTKI